MFDFVFGLIFLWIMFNIFAGFTKNARKTVKPKPWRPANSDTGSYTAPQHAHDEADEFEELKARVKSISKQQAVQFGRKAERQRAKDLDDDHEAHVVNPSKNRDAQDKNMHRREDWGARAGPGILSTANILVFVAFALVVSLLIEFLSLL